VIQILKFIFSFSQAVMPLLSFEMMGFAAFAIAILQNALIGIDTRREPVVDEISQETN